ncbi:hypothetical protein Tco_0072311 [Tanacetum coccineum]
MEKKDTLSSCSESEEQQMQLIQDKSKESCMVSFQRLHSHLKRLSNNDLKGSRTENGFGRAFATLFGQDFEIFTGTMFLNMDQLQKQLDNNEFQEIGSMASFKVLETQFQMFINSQIYLNDEYISIDERALHKMEYDSRVNERQTQTTVEKVDTSKELDASLVIIESNGTESQEQDTSSRSGNDAHVDDADIRPIDNEEPMAEVQTTADDNVSATGQQHTEQPESNNEGEVDQNADQCYDTCPLPAKLTDDKTIELSTQLLEFENICLKKTVAQFQKDFSRMEAHCVNLELKYQNQVLKEGQQAKNIEHTTSLIANNDKFKAQLQEKGFAIAALKNELRKLTGNSVNTKFAKPSILGKPVLQPHRNQFVVRQPTAFKSERPKISKERFAFQVDVSNDLLKLVTTHYLPKRREFAKPHNMIATSSSRWVPTGKIFTSSTTKVDSEPPNGSKEDITNQCESEQALDVSAGTLLSTADQASVFMEMTSVHISSGLVLHQMTSDHNRSELGIQDHSNEQSSSKLVPKVVPLAVKTATSRQELELLFHHHIAMLRTTGRNRVNTYAVRITLIADIENDIMDPVMQCQPSQQSGFLNRNLSHLARNTHGIYWHLQSEIVDIE